MPDARQGFACSALTGESEPVSEAVLRYEITAKTTISTTPDELWNLMQDLEDWWPKSNPEHQSLEILSKDKTIREGTPIRIREQIAGVPGEAVGEIRDVLDGEQVTWSSDRAVYQYLGVSLAVEEGVTWTLRDLGSGATELSARVWARFPPTLKGRIFWWVFRYLLNGVERDYRHALAEVEYLKARLEMGDSLETT